jgi:hypothetical protein
MSSLPSISHRLFVAAVGRGAPDRSRKSGGRVAAEPEDGDLSQTADVMIHAAESALRPAAREISVSALMSET